MMIYTFLMKILVMPHFQVMKWVFSVKILIILTLMMLTFMKMILKILFMTHFWLSIIDLNNAKHLNFNGCSKTSNTTVRLVHAKR